jgi:copper resistance protein B
MKTYPFLMLLPCCTLAHAMDMNGMAGMDMSAMPGMDMTQHATHHPAVKPPAKAAAHKHPILKAASVPAPLHPTEMPMNVAPPAQSEPMNMEDMPGMDHAAMQSPEQPAMQMDHANGDMAGMQMGHGHAMAMPTVAPASRSGRSSDYSQGRDFGPIHPPMMMGNDPLYSLKLNRLEWLHSTGLNQGGYAFEGWWGTDWDRAVLKAEGDFDRHSLNDARTELLWRRPLTAFWNTELGIRQDSGNAQDRTWLALGINGIAPYWLDLDVSAYVRDQGQTALIIESDYDWRLTQRLILQPRLEAKLYGKADRVNDLGSGLSELQTGLRLRYELSRQFAPYIGVEATRHYGQTVKFLKQDGEHSAQNAAVAGVMLWF